MVNSAENDERVAAIVSKALRQPPAKRESYLRFACNDDPELYQETAEAVKWEERMGSFLLLPAIATREFPRPFAAGQIISERFEIVREIGEGGMGVVYEAFDRKRNQRIAIKSAKPGFHRLLTPELANALKVRHPHVCLVNEIHTAQTSHGEIDFLTMEFLEGETLSKRLAAQGKLPNQEALEIACQLCAGLAEAHRSNVLHRDLKSANIILCSGSSGVRAVITDFGLASDMTQAGEMGGTPRYMAPELWRGEKASKASDIYALGVVLYEMVAGRPPIEDEADRVKSRPPLPSTLVKGLAPQWDRVILECLRPAPEGRPADAALVFSELKKKPMRKAPLLAALMLAASSLVVPEVRGWLRDLIWPPPSVRLAVLPSEGPADTAVMAGGVLQDVSDRIGHLHSGRRAVAVISPADAAKQPCANPGTSKPGFARDPCFTDQGASRGRRPGSSGFGHRSEHARSGTATLKDGIRRPRSEACPRRSLVLFRPLCVCMAPRPRRLSLPKRRHSMIGGCTFCARTIKASMKRYRNLSRQPV